MRTGVLIVVILMMTIMIRNHVVFAAQDPDEVSSFPTDSTRLELSKGQKRFPYVNPVYPADAPDPALLRVGDYFYAAVTGQRIIRSRDLIHWETVGHMFSAGLPPWVDPVSPDIWAPDLHFIDGKYVIYFSGRERGHESIHMGVGVAWSERPEGPYQGTDHALASGPSFRNIDPAAFRDDDGTWYLYWGSAEAPILVQQLAPDGLSLVGEARVALNPIPYTRYSRLVEAPWVIKRGDYYYLFWSGSNFIPGEYAMSVARSTSPLGPFERFPGNPVLEGNDVWASPGHNALIQDDAGQDWVFYHAYDWADTTIGRLLLMDQLVWRDGWPHVVGNSPSSLPNEGPIWRTTAIPLVEFALDKEVWASSEEEGRSAKLAVDLSTQTSWLPERDDQEPWIVVDLGESRRVAKVELRFVKSGDRRYQIETSQEGETWHLFADRSRFSTYPYSEVGEATARYVRVKLRGPAREDDAVRSLRVYVYQDVWISSPAISQPVTTPFPIEVNVSEDMSVKRVTIDAGGETLYEDEAAPQATVMSGYLPDGHHHVVLEVVDEREAIWRHEITVPVRNALIVEPIVGAVLQGETTFRFYSGYDREYLDEASIIMVPIREGELITAETVTLFEGDRVPGEIVVDTRTLPDGTYQLEFTVVSKTGHVARSAHAIILRNWEVLSDRFEPPSVSSLFGTLERKRTVDESAGWGYDTTDVESFFGDKDRRVWSGDGAGHLIWELPDLDRFMITLYARDLDLTGLHLSVSADRQTWSDVDWRAEKKDVSSSGWFKVQVTGGINQPTAVRYFRLGVSERLSQDVMQLGHVELAYEAE